jgi:HEAT repeat protein
MQEADDLTQLLAELVDGDLAAAALYNLSNLHGQDLQRFSETWTELPAERRQMAMARMIEIAEADFEVDFTEVFKIGMDDPDAAVRAAAIEGLWEVEDAVLIRPTVRMLDKDPAIQVREAAALALSRFALLAEMGRLQPRLADLVWEALWGAVHRAEEDVAVRRRVLEALAYFDRAEVAALIERAYEDPEPRMRISAIFAMGRTGHERWAKPVLAELESEDPEMRFEATRACGELRLIEATQDLSMLITDPDPEVRLAAVWSLGQIGSGEARRVLEICLEQGDEALQDAADEALGWLSFVQGDIDFSLVDFDPEEQDDDLLPWDDED